MCRDLAGTGSKVYFASKPVSMRLGFDGLAALVRPLFAVEPYCGHVFLFRSKSGNYLKALHWDGTGLCLFAKRLERHRFVWPPLMEGGVVLTSAQFALLISDGLAPHGGTRTAASAGADLKR